jgi:hypothetical protein
LLESRTTDDEDDFRETPYVRAPMRARKYTTLTTMTKTWEHEFAVERMREDPTISYRALAKVLGISDSTIRQWRDEEGIQPRPHHNTGRRRNGARSIQWFAPPTRNRDEDRDEDQDEDQDDLEDIEEEEFDPDAEPSVRRSEVLAAPGFGPAWEAMNGLFGWKGPKSSRSTLAPASKRKQSIPEDPRARLGAISAELRAGKPRGSEAVGLLVEAVPYLTGGVNALAQYGDGLGCTPEDIAAAERAVIGRAKH